MKLKIMGIKPNAIKIKKAGATKKRTFESFCLGVKAIIMLPSQYGLFPNILACYQQTEWNWILNLRLPFFSNLKLAYPQKGRCKHPRLADAYTCSKQYLYLLISQRYLRQISAIHQTVQLYRHQRQWLRRHC